MVWVKPRPMDRAASAWPSGMELTPDRSASHTKVEVYMVRARMFNQKKPNWMSSFGKPNTTSSRRTSSGVLRKTVT